MLVRIQFLKNPRVPPQDLSTKGESGLKKLKGIVNGQQVNILVLPFVNLEGWVKEARSYWFKDARCGYFFKVS